jgi:hypothetical protein
VNTLRFAANQKLDLQQVEGEAAITGWDQADIELVLDGDPDQCQAEQQQDALVIRSQAALAIHVPHDIAVHIGQASGELILRDLGGRVSVDTAEGDLSIGMCSGEVTVHDAEGSLVAEQLAATLDIGRAHDDVHLHHVTAVRLAKAYSSVYARTVDGAIALGVVHGDVQARQVAGPLTLEEGQGSFRGQDLQGGMNLRQVSGDLALKTDAAPGQRYHARVEGAITAWFPAEISARFILEAGGNISARLPEIESQETGRVLGRAGSGEAEIDLHADEDIFVQVQGQGEGAFDAWSAMESISAQIEAEIAQHLGGMSVDAMVQREIDKALSKAEHEIAKAQRHLEQDSLRAQESARRAQERAARAAQRAQAKIARKSREWGVSVEAGPSLFGPALPMRPPRAVDRGPSSEEQLAILKMLQENKITVAQAEALLAALGG